MRLRLCCSCKQIVTYSSAVVLFAASLSHKILLQMATRLQFVRTSWLSRHLCRSSLSVSQIQCINTEVPSRNMSASKGALGKCLQMENINPCIKTMEYAVRWDINCSSSHQTRFRVFRTTKTCNWAIVIIPWLNLDYRGPLVIRATAIEKELEQVIEPAVDNFFFFFFLEFHFRRKFFRGKKHNKINFPSISLHIFNRVKEERTKEKKKSCSLHKWPVCI